MKSLRASLEGPIADPLFSKVVEPRLGNRYINIYIAIQASFSPYFGVYPCWPIDAKAGNLSVSQPQTSPSVHASFKESYAASILVISDWIVPQVLNWNVENVVVYIA